MRILILGAGGVGGYLGARLIENGQQVAFLLRPSTAEMIRQSGLSVRSPLGDWAGAVDIAGPENDAYDLVILCCKAYDLDLALQTLGPFVRKGTLVLPLLNGVQHIGRISHALPDAHVLGGVAHIGATTNGPGRIVHLNTLATFVAGPLRHGTPAPESLKDLFSSINGTGLTMRFVDDASVPMWTKLVFLATLAGATCLQDADIGTILKRPGGETLILDLLEETRLIAAAEGFDPPADELSGYRRQLTEAGSTATASMLRDMRAGRPTEAEHIIGDLVSRAIRHKIETPNLVAVLRHMRAYEQKRGTP